MPERIIKQNLLYPELSYKIIGIAFELYNKFSYTCREKYIQNAFESEFKKEKIKYLRERCINLYHNNGFESFYHQKQHS